MKFNPGDLIEFTELDYFIYLADPGRHLTKTPEQVLLGDMKTAWGLYLRRATIKLLLDCNLRNIVRSASQDNYHQIILLGKVYFVHYNSFRLAEV